MNPEQDQLCADTINRIIQSGSSERKSLAAAAPVQENKVKLINEFIRSGGKVVHVRSGISNSKAASASAPVQENKAQVIANFISRYRR